VEVHLDHHVERAPVPRGHDIGEKLVVGDRDHVVIERDQAHRAQSDRRDLAINPRERDPIADLKRPIRNTGGPRLTQDRNSSA
jgi:hypothetical protein